MPRYVNNDVFYDGFWDWFLVIRDPRDLYQHQPSYLAVELITYFMTILCVIHAWKRGGRFPFLLVAAFWHAWFVECITYWVPDIDNFWHAQTVLTFIGQRFPLYIQLFYVCFTYCSHTAASRLHLAWYALPFCTGILDTLYDIPYDIMGIKLIWWTWHDTDAPIFDRHYWVPWCSYFFHASFQAGVVTGFYGLHYLITGKGRYEYAGFFKEALVVLLTGMLGMPIGVLQFMILYHPLHDSLGIHTEVVVLILFAIYGMFWWKSDRQPQPVARRRAKNNSGWFDEVALAMATWYIFYLLLVNYFSPDPENIVAKGLHERVGPCNETLGVQTVYGVMNRSKYLCPTNYDEKVFDWHCLPEGKPPPDYSYWYSICGTPYPNYAEYRIVVSAFCFLGMFIYYQCLARSGEDVGLRQITSGRGAAAAGGSVKKGQ